MESKPHETPRPARRLVNLLLNSDFTVNLTTRMIHSMYAKLFSRIAQSSLMEEPIETRYTFMMLLAIADQSGDVIGTDVALARTINLPLATFTEAVKALMEPDPHSNSQDQEGRRLVPSDNGRGYRIVNYTAYRAIKTAEEKKTYMREYMRARRESLKAKDVTAVNICKSALSDVTHAEAEADTEGEAGNTIPPQVVAAAPERFSRPSTQDVAAYGETLTPPFSRSAEFVDFYESKGWKVGKTAMKDWKAAVRNWHRSDTKQKPAKTYSHANGYNESTSIDHL